MKSTQRTTCTLDPCAKAGARWAARMPATPVSLMNVRRSIEPPPVGSGPLSLVDLLELTLGPLHGVLGRHALHALGVHVGDDVFGEGLRGLRGGRPGVAEQPRVAGGRAEHLQRLVELAPHRVVLPLVGGADRVALLRGEPLAVVLRLVQPGQEVLRELRILAVLHDGVRLVQEQQVAAGGPRRQWRMVDILPERLALVVLDLVLLTLGDDVDRRAVERGRELAGVEGAVVVGVVPRQAAFVAALLPERLHELHRRSGALAVEHDLLGRLVGLGGAEGPRYWVREGRRVAEGVTERLTVGMALLLQRGEDLARLVPGLGIGAGPDFLQPRLPVGDGVADDRVRHREPLAVDLAGRRPYLVEAALRLRQRAGDVAHVDDGVLVEVRPVVLEVEDVRARARLDGGRDARLQVVGVDRLELDLRAQRLLRLGHLALELDVRLRDEVHPAHPVQGAALRERRRLPRGEDPGDAGDLEEVPSIYRLHVHSRILLDDSFNWRRRRAWFP